MRIVKLLAKNIALSGIVGIILISACTDKTSQIGADLVPNGPLSDLNRIDTMSMNAYSVKVDSVLTTGQAENLIGFLNDPVFGKVVSSTYAQLIPDAFSFKGFDGYVLDSVVFSLKYSKSYYGDTLTTQTIHIHEITEPFERGGLYYSNHELQYNPVPIVSHTYNPTPLKTDTSVSVRPSLEVRMKIPVENLFVTNLWNLDSTSLHTDTSLVNLDEFVKLVNGIHIKVDPSDGETGALVGFNMTSVDTKLTFYTKEDNEDANLKEFDFVIIPNYSAWLNKHDHMNFEGAETDLLNQINNINKESSKEKLYIQPLAGTRVHFDFPHLKSLNDIGNIIINKAELILSYGEDDELTDLNIFNPTGLNIGLRHINDTTTVVPDYYVDGGRGVHLGGSIDTTNKEYRFRLTRYVQEVLQNKDENELGLVLFSGSETNGYSRLIFRGFDPVNSEFFDNRFRLEVTYSIIE